MTSFCILSKYGCLNVQLVFVNQNAVSRAKWLIKQSLKLAFNECHLVSGNEVQFVQGEIFYPDDDPEERSVYRGQVCHGLPWGNGTMTWSHGAVYNGEWNRGKRHGSGNYTLKPIMSNELPIDTDPLDFHVRNPHENLNPLFKLLLSKTKIEDSGKKEVETHESFSPAFGDLHNSAYTLGKSDEEITKPFSGNSDEDLNKFAYQQENSGEKVESLAESFMVKLLLASEPESNRTSETERHDSNFQELSNDVNADNVNDDADNVKAGNIDDDVYIGKWENDIMHGDGVYTWSKSNTLHVKYEGGISGGLKSGHGKEIWKKILEVHWHIRGRRPLRHRNVDVEEW
jgi:hypothetical protein